MVSRNYVSHELQISQNTVFEWYKEFKEIISCYLEEKSELLGGVTENDEPITVEIDESYFFRRKYNKGAYRHGRWVFGAIERGTRHCFLQVVEDRSRETLENLIMK